VAIINAKRTRGRPRKKNLENSTEIFDKPQAAYTDREQVDYWVINAANMKDAYWRLHHIYHVKNDKGKVVPFRPNAEQSALYKAILKDGKRNILIIKARQLGMSTAIEMFILDSLAFGQGIQAAIVDQTQGDASKKLNNKIKLGWNYLPKEFRKAYHHPKENDGIFSCQLVGHPEVNEVQAGLTARGDTFQILHISEWGPIQALDAARSEEILTGAMPAAKDGIRIIETTWKGGKNGHLWDLTKRAIDMPEQDKTREDFHLFFFPWFNDPQYNTEGRVEQIDEETMEYFRAMEKETGHTFTDTQKMWYYKKAIPMALHRFQEFPTTLAEAFTGSTEGVILHSQVMTARLEKRVFNFKHDPTELVYTFWDLGAPVNMCTWYAQFIGREIHLIDVDMELDLDLIDRLARMLQKPYAYGGHYFPHDAAAKEKSGKNFLEQVAPRLGHCRVIPRARSMSAANWPGIDHLRSMFPRMVFNKAPCDPALERLEAYRTKVDRTNGYVTETIVHDQCSHVADGLRMLAEADLNQMLGST
jgi:hypothetical protein